MSLLKFPFALASVICVSLGAGGSHASAAPSLVTLHSFNGTDGANPAAALSIDQSGNLFGTARFGGQNIAENGGDGTVFELPKQDYHSEVTLFAFSGPNGANPSSSLVVDPSNRLFGTTSFGGQSGGGTVFELSAGAFTSLASFGGSVGANPTSLTSLPVHGTGSSFTLFGTTIQGGANSNGTVFKLSGANLTDLSATASFGGQFAEQAGATLVTGPHGALYGMDATAGQNGQGIVFRLSGPDHGTIDVLATFTSVYEGAPPGGLTVDSKGNLYGIISGGGPDGSGVLFELKRLHDRFVTLASGSEPVGAPLVDAAGNIYGATSVGGLNNMGTVFRISADHSTYTVLHNFSGLDGANPFAGLVNDSSGNLFGTTSNGGKHGKGTVFMIRGTGFQNSH